jgi:hypothetical protein
VQSATVTGDGALTGRDVVLNGTSGSVGLTWTRTPEPGPSLEATIARLQSEYKALKLEPPR